MGSGKWETGNREAKKGKRASKPDAVKAIFFDVGGVLIWDDAKDTLMRQSRKLGIPFHELRDDMRPDRLLLMKGKIPRREYLKRVLNHFGIPPIRIRDLVAAIPRRYRYHGAVWNIARTLRRNGYRIGIITNVMPPFPFGPRLQLHPLFRPIIRSYQVGAAKPEREIFAIAIQRARVSFRESIFLDDRPRNIAAAKRLGMRAFRYENPPQLVRSLRRFGVGI